MKNVWGTDQLGKVGLWGFGERKELVIRTENKDTGCYPRSFHTGSLFLKWLSWCALIHVL